MHAWLVDARLSYTSGDRARGRWSLASALRLAAPEQLRLPFAVKRSWIGPVLGRDRELVGTTGICSRRRWATISFRLR